MPTVIEVLLANLQEAIKNLQKYIASGLGASVFFLLLVLSKVTEVTVQAPAVGSSLPVSISTALTISVSIFWVSGLLASQLVARANRLIRDLRKSAPDLAEAALLYPSIATVRIWFPRIMAVLLPPVLVVVGLAKMYGTKLLAYESLFGLLVLTLPNIVLVVALRKSLGGYHPSDEGD